MNKAAYQAGNLILCARTALKGRKKLAYRDDPQIHIQHFSIPSADRQGMRALSTLQWFERMQLAGAVDFKLYLPTVQVSANLGRGPWDQQAQIVCVFNDRADVFSPQWQFDPSLGIWNVTYTQLEDGLDPADPDLNVGDNTLSFARILGEIADFASDINCGNFADIFNAALDALKGNDGHAPLIAPTVKLPENISRIYAATDLADVFGDTGSWVDLPPLEADKRGEYDTYLKLTNRLFLEQRQALMYAINSVSCEPEGGRDTSGGSESSLAFKVILGLGAAGIIALLLAVALS